MSIALNAIVFIALPAPLSGQPVPISPNGKWSVKYDPASCTLSRDFGDASEGLTLAIKPSAIGIKTEILLISKNDLSGLISGEMNFRVGLQDKIANFETVIIKKTQLRVVRIYVDDSDFDQMEDAENITFPISKQKSVILTSANFKSGITAVKKCRVDLQKSWGMDPAALIPTGGKTEGKTVAGADVRYWLTYNDYPAEAVRNHSEGDSQIIWRIDEEGRIKDCRTVVSSGSKALDDAACSAVTRRGRYVPAKGPDGRAKTSWSGMTAVWRIP